MSESALRSSASALREDAAKKSPAAFLNGDPQPQRLARDGERDLSFSGWRLTEQCTERETDGTVLDRRVCVSIFVTVGGQYVGRVYREYGSTRSEINDVCVSRDPNQIYAFLKRNNGGSFGGLSRKAWEEACEKYAPLAEHATERID